MFSPPRLQGHRNRRAWTQQELATAVSETFPIESIINWELGVTEPSERYHSILCSSPRLDIPYEQLEPVEGLTDVQQYSDALNWSVPPPPLEPPPVESPPAT